MIKLVSPLRVPKSLSKHFILNINNYRNSHYQTLNKTKIEYKKLMSEQISKIPKISEPIHIHYTLYTATKRKCDIDNVISIHKKYLQDALVELGKLEDDDYTFIPSNSESFGGIDKNNPRVDVVIVSQKDYILNPSKVFK